MHITIRLLHKLSSSDFGQLHICSIDMQSTLPALHKLANRISAPAAHTREKRFRMVFGHVYVHIALSYVGTPVPSYETTVDETSISHLWKKATHLSNRLQSLIATIVVTRWSANHECASWLQAVGWM